MHKRTTFKTAAQLADEYLARQIEQAPDAATKAKFEAVRQQARKPVSKPDNN